MSNNQKKSVSALKLTFIGIIAGFVSGFFGAGGGVVLIISASLLMKNQNTKDIFARTAVMTALFSIVSAITYIKRGDVPILSSVLLFIPAFLGGICGAILLDKIRIRVLRIIFGVISAVGGIIMLAS